MVGFPILCWDQVLEHTESVVKFMRLWIILSRFMCYHVPGSCTSLLYGGRIHVSIAFARTIFQGSGDYGNHQVINRIVLKVTLVTIRLLSLPTQANVRVRNVWNQLWNPHTCSTSPWLHVLSSARPLPLSCNLVVLLFQLLLAWLRFRVVEFQMYQGRGTYCIQSELSWNWVSELVSEPLELADFFMCCHLPGLAQIWEGPILKVELLNNFWLESEGLWSRVFKKSVIVVVISAIAFTEKDPYVRTLALFI